MNRPLLTVALAAGLGIAVNAQAQTTIATVNGQEVTEEQLALMARQQADVSLDQLNDQQKNQLLQQLVRLSLLAQEAESDGLGQSAEVIARLEANRRAVLAQSALERVAGADEIDEAAVRERYEERYGDDDAGATELRARHILVEEEDTARSLIEQLEDGADFAELAEEHSTGPTASRGGDLGWFSAAQMVPTFSEAAQALDEGEFTREPVQTRFGWHVIKLDDRRTAEPPAFAEVRESLRGELVSERVQAHIEELEGGAEVEYQVDWADRD